MLQQKGAVGGGNKANLKLMTQIIINSFSVFLAVDLESLKFMLGNFLVEQDVKRY